jgi:hypothetical protein
MDIHDVSFLFHLNVFSPYSHKSLNKNFLDQHDIKVALHKYVFKKSQFFTCSTWFLASLIMITPNEPLLHSENLPKHRTSSLQENQKTIQFLV